MIDDQTFLAMVHLWAATAWSDGVLAKNERTLLEGVIGNAGVSAAAKTKALGFLEKPVTLDAADAKRLSPNDRRGVYRAACRMTSVDRRVDDAERAFLQRLGVVLELDAATMADIEKNFIRK